MLSKNNSSIRNQSNVLRLSQMRLTVRSKLDKQLFVYNDRKCFAYDRNPQKIEYHNEDECCEECEDREECIALRNNIINTLTTLYVINLKDGMYNFRENNIFKH
jgi:hypothetical protein